MNALAKLFSLGLVVLWKPRWSAHFIMGWRYGGAPMFGLGPMGPIGPTPAGGGWRPAVAGGGWLADEWRRFSGRHLLMLAGASEMPFVNALGNSTLLTTPLQ